MEHASRGRRSGNKGVGARWRGRFRIFSARHCSRTKVSHAENSGMTMLFFSWGLLRCRACVDHRRGCERILPTVVPDIRRGDSRDGKQPPRIVSSAPSRCVLRSGASHSLQWGGMPALRRRFRNDDGLGVVVVCSEGDCGSMCWPVDRPATHAAAGAAARGALIFLFWGILSHAREWTARGLMRFKTAKFYGPLQTRPNSPQMAL